MHGILIINNPIGAYCNMHLPKTEFKSSVNNVGSIVRGYKSAVTKQINAIRNITSEPIWQRNYHEHIIRNEKIYEKIYNYIINNPQTWGDDKFFLN